jgi:LysM repeat protein
MKKRKLLLAILFLTSGQLLMAQSPETVRKYIAAYKDIAIAEELRTGVPAAITLAQGIHETGAGTSDLVVKSNNHFGIKCKTEWSGERVFHDDDARGECFRKYTDPMDSYKDHSDFLKNRPYYASLFTIDPTDYKAWAFGLKKAGYATNPKYAQILIKLIEDYNLQEYTMLALNSKKDGGNGLSFASLPAKTAPSEIREEQVQPPILSSNYPSGVFRINETNVVFVAKGTSFLMVANENNISLSRIFEFNDMKPADVAEKDALIFLQRKRKLGASEYHFVKPGETTYDIAQIEGIRLERLLEFNFLRADMRPMAGERLFLQTKAPGMPRLAMEEKTLPSILPAQANQHSDAFIVHIVQPKETVFGIARKYDVAMEDVRKWNDLSTTELKTGQPLRINKKRTDASN